MTKVRRGGYVFITWKSDHPPRHVHVFCEGVLVVKWDLEKGRPITGLASRGVLRLVRELESEGRL